MVEQKNFLIMCQDISMAGAQRSSVNLARALSEAGHHVVFVAMQRKDYKAFDTPFPVVYLTDQKLKPALFMHHRLARRLSKWLKQYDKKFDLIISNNYGCNRVLKIADIKPRVMLVRNPPRAELELNREYGFFKYAKWYANKFKTFSGEHLIAVSKDLAESVRDDSAIRAKSLKMIYNVMYCDDIRSAANEHDEGIPNQPYIIHVGRFVWQKNHDFLFEALGKTKSKVPLVLLCDKEEKARKKAADHGIADRIILPGFKKNPYPWIKNAKCLVLSSNYEGFGLVISEALSLNVPVVSLDTGHGPREQLDGVNGSVLVSKRCTESFAQKLDEVLNSKEKAQSDNASILQELVPSKIAQHYVEYASERTD